MSTPPATTTSSQDELEAYKDQIKCRGETLLFEEIPVTILTLNSLLNTPEFKNGDLAKCPTVKRIIISGEEPPPKRLRRTHHHHQPPEQRGGDNRPEIRTTLPSNINLINIMQRVKPHMTKLLEDSKLLKIWIQILIPQIQGGNNFGVHIQELVVLIVGQVERLTTWHKNSISFYFNQRANVWRDFVKYPQVEDFRTAIKEMDEGQYVAMVLGLTEVRNYYCMLHDMIIKNFNKLKNPRVENAFESLY